MDDLEHKIQFRDMNIEVKRLSQKKLRYEL